MLCMREAAKARILTSFWRWDPVSRGKFTLNSGKIDFCDDDFWPSLGVFFIPPSKFPALSAQRMKWRSQNPFSCDRRPFGGLVSLCGNCFSILRFLWNSADLGTNIFLYIYLPALQNGDHRGIAGPWNVLDPGCSEASIWDISDLSWSNLSLIWSCEKKLVATQNPEISRGAGVILSRQKNSPFNSAQALRGFSVFWPGKTIISCLKMGHN